MQKRRDLKIAPNTSITVEFMFDSPKVFESKLNPGQMRHAWSLKVREDSTGTYRVGEEVVYFTSHGPEIALLEAFGKGDVAVIRLVQNPGERFPTMLVDEPTNNVPQGKEPARIQAGSYLYPDENPDIIEMMERCMRAASRIRGTLVEDGVVLPEDVGEYWITKVGLTIWMQVK